MTKIIHKKYNIPLTSPPKKNPLKKTKISLKILQFAAGEVLSIFGGIFIFLGRCLHFLREKK